MADENKGYKSETDSEILDKIDRLFSYALDHPSWTAGRDNMIRCFKYREGEQWTSEELKELEQERNQPATVNNQISVVVSKLVGDLINQRYRIGFRGRNEAVDKEAAKALTDVFLHIRQTNDLEFEERDMAADGFTSGFGVMEVAVTFDDMFQPQIQVRHEDPLIVFPDPDSRRYDWNEDANYICRAKWFGISEAVELFPKSRDLLKSRSGDFAGETGSQLSAVDKFKNENYIDKKNRRIRIIEVQYKKLKRQALTLFADGSTAVDEEAKEKIKLAEEQGVAHRTIDRVTHTICIGTYAAGILLEHKETDFKYFSLIPYFAYRRKSGEPYSLITLALSMQDAINKRESKALHLLNTNQVIFETNALPDPNKFAEEMAKPDGMMEVANGSLTQQKVQFQRNIELATTQFTMHVRAAEDLYRIVGIDPKIASSTGEIRSGTGLQRKFAEASKPVAVLFDNVRRTRKITGRVVLDRVGKYYTPQKVMLITDDENKVRSLQLTAPLIAQVKSGIYDVVVDDFEDTATSSQEQFNQIINILPNILKFGPFWVKKLLQLSTIRDKDAVVKELEAMNGPPPIEPRLSIQANINELLPEERAFFYERMGNPELAQLIRKKQPMTTSEEKGSVELAKTTIKEGKRA